MLFRLLITHEKKKIEVCMWVDVSLFSDQKPKGKTEGFCDNAKVKSKIPFFYSILGESKIIIESS